MAEHPKNTGCINSSVPLPEQLQLSGYTLQIENKVKLL